MRVIESANYPVEPVVQVRCPGCDALLEVSSEDVTFELAWGAAHWDGGQEPIVRFTCGACQYPTAVNDGAHFDALRPRAA